jgi:hypothetical protein
VYVYDGVNNIVFDVDVHIGLNRLILKNDVLYFFHSACHKYVARGTLV